jgi:hypothetical protein
VPQSDVNLTFLPNAWSGANLTSSTQLWPFVLVRSPLFLSPYYVLIFMFNIDSQAILLWRKGGKGKWLRVQILDAGQSENRGVSLMSISAVTATRTASHC